MKIRHVLLAISSMCLTTSVVFADYQPLNNAAASDPLEQLSRSLGQGSYSQASYNPSQATTQNEPSTSFNNASLAQYGSSDTAALGAWLSTYPIENARVSSTYGMRTLMGSTRQHSGIDLAAPTGTSIYATGAGVVTKSGWGTGYGNYVEIDHGNGYLTRYAHASKLNVKVGDYVSAGEHIANVGCTGRCTGPHLHFEIVKNGKRQNPSTYLALLP